LVVMLTDTLGMLRERSLAMYVSVAIVVVDRTKNGAHPALAICGLELRRVVPWLVPPVLELKVRPMESFAAVTVLFAASLTQTVIVDCDEPFAGIGSGDALATRCVATPLPANEIVVAAGVKPVEVAVAVHASMTGSLIVNVTVVPLGEVVAVAGFPAPPAGVVVETVAPQAVVVFG
jgi:hypothetical protein